MKQNQIYEYLVSLMEERYYNFSISAWQDILLDISMKARNYELICIEYIPVTKKELIIIDSLKSRPMQRVAFTLLCLAKYKNSANAKNNNWVSYEYKEIFKMANVTATIKEQCHIIHDMIELSLIRMNKMVDNLSINVSYIDYERSNVVLNIDDFRNLGYEYLMYRGEKFYRCKRCNILKRRTATNNIYCAECAEIVKQDKDRLRMQNNRLSRKQEVALP